ncbi:hypothetical protein, partial [Pseudorhodoplanes sinuspersici]|uniref:hypothetical protein n=1 Tax=Pseudorhodoplanes sinuspersici TaxID=1235591 RepID=UPI001AECB6BD
SLNSRPNFRLCMATSGFMKHPILVSIKPAAAQTRQNQALGFAVLYANGAPEEIRTPAPQIRSLNFRELVLRVATLQSKRAALMGGSFSN